MDVLEAIQRRRSIKPDLMRPDPIDRATIERLLEAANWAPSHGLTEPWRFQVFQRGPEREALFEAIAQTLAQPGEPPIPADDPRRLGLAKKMLQPPVMIAIVCRPSPNPKIVLEEEIASTAIAVQNLHLAATELGLGGFWTSGKKASDPGVVAVLGLEPSERCLGFFYLGWPAGEWPEGQRGPAMAKVRWRD